MTREEKAAARKAKRQEKNITPRPNIVLDKPASLHDIEKPAALNMQKPVPAMETPEIFNSKAEVNNPVGIGSDRLGKKVESVNPIVAKAEATNPAKITNPNEVKALTPWEQMLANQRAQYMKEKTDAVKMQKYSALTDALNAIGKMGGTAIGGAIGGNMLDSAPVVGEYQPSRGYVDAFEQARQANERLRALDEKEFNLALRDEDRSYRQQEAKLDREYRKQLLDYEHQLRQAQAQKNYDLELELKTKIENLTHEHDMARENLSGQYEIKSKDKSLEIVREQNRDKSDGYGKSGTVGKDFIPVRFSNRKVVDIPIGYYNEIVNSLIGRDVNGVYVDENNARKVIEDNPELINEYLVDYGIVEAPADKPVAQTPDEQSAPKKKTFKERVAEYGKMAGGINAGTYNGLRYKNEGNNSEEKSAEEESLEEYNAKYKSNRKRN